MSFGFFQEIGMKLMARLIDEIVLYNDVVKEMGQRMRLGRARAAL